MRVGEKGWLLDALAERMCFCSKVFFVFEGRLEVAVLLLDNNNQHAATKTAVEHICSLEPQASLPRFHHAHPQFSSANPVTQGLIAPTAPWFLSHCGMTAP